MAVFISERPRLLAWDRNAKLLALASLVQAFLFSLLDDSFLTLRSWLLDHWCHRTGKWNRSTTDPLYRSRLALSQLWLAFRSFCLPRLNQGCIMSCVRLPISFDEDHGEIQSSML